MMVSRTVKQSDEMVYVTGDEDQTHSEEYMEFDKIAQSYGLPIAKMQEKELKRLRRRVKNKISAQESRRRKKEYIDNLEHRVRSSDQENEELKQKIAHMETRMRSLVDELFLVKQALAQGSHLSNTGSNLRKTKLVTRATQTGICLQCYYEGGLLPYSNGMSMEIEQNTFQYDLKRRCGTLVDGKYGTARALAVHNSKEPFQPFENVKYVTEQKLQEAKLSSMYHKAVKQMEICESNERDVQNDIQSKDFSKDSFVVYSSKNVILIKEPVVHPGKSQKPHAKYMKSKCREACNGLQRNTALRIDDTHERQHVSTQMANFSSSLDMEEQQSPDSVENSAASNLCSPEHKVINYKSDPEGTGRPKSATLNCGRKTTESSQSVRKRCYSHPSCAIERSCNEQTKGWHLISEKEDPKQIGRHV